MPSLGGARDANIHQPTEHQFARVLIRRSRAVASSLDGRSWRQHLSRYLSEDTKIRAKPSASIARREYPSPAFRSGRASGRRQVRIEAGGV